MTVYSYNKLSQKERVRLDHYEARKHRGERLSDGESDQHQALLKKAQIKETSMRILTPAGWKTVEKIDESGEGNYSNLQSTKNKAEAEGRAALQKRNARNPYKGRPGMEHHAKAWDKGYGNARGGVKPLGEEEAPQKTVSASAADMKKNLARVKRRLGKLKSRLGGQPTLKNSVSEEINKELGEQGLIPGGSSKMWLQTKKLRKNIKSYLRKPYTRDDANNRARKFDQHSRLNKLGPYLANRIAGIKEPGKVPGRVKRRSGMYYEETEE